MRSKVSVVLIAALLSVALPRKGANADGIQQFIAQHANQEKCFAVKDLPLTDSIDSGFNPREDQGYLALRAHYSRAVALMQAHFPEISFNAEILRVLRPYLGKRDVFAFTAAPYPFYLFYSAVMPGRPSSYQRLEARCGEKPVLGLRISTSLDAVYYQREPAVVEDLRYFSSSNARIFGFTHAQLILPLSTGVRTADTFRYNGFLPWSKHRRYQQEDQASKAIALTNYGHSSRSESFLESDHPDFAIELTNFKGQTAVVTMFLWREVSALSLLGASQKVNRVPDFIFQLYLIPPHLN